MMNRTELTMDQMELVNGGEEATSDIEQILDKVTPTSVKNTCNTV